MNPDSEEWWVGWVRMDGWIMVWQDGEEGVHVDGRGVIVDGPNLSIIVQVLEC